MGDEATDQREEGERSARGLYKVYTNDQMKKKKMRFPLTLITCERLDPSFWD